MVLEQEHSNKNINVSEAGKIVTLNVPREILDVLRAVVAQLNQD